MARSLFDTGTWSDLTIRTATHTFQVHKNIVCTACPVLQAACSGGWKEAQTGVIELPEPEHVVRAMLAYCYGLLNTDDFDKDSPLDCMISWGELLVAADKVHLWSRLHDRMHG